MKTHSLHTPPVECYSLRNPSHLHLYCVIKATTTDFPCNTSSRGFLPFCRHKKARETFVALKLADFLLSMAENWSLATFIIYWKFLVSPHYERLTLGLTVKSTKYFWLFSPTQLLTQGQWWSIFRMQRLQTLWESQQGKCEGQGNRFK